MERIYYVKDYLKDTKSDSEAIEACFADGAKAGGKTTVVFDGKDYFIDRAILVPSDTSIIVDNCTIKQNDDVFDNIFRGNNLIINGIDPYGRPIDVTPIHNIKIIGKVNSVSVLYVGANINVVNIALLTVVKAYGPAHRLADLQIADLDANAK